ncbi:YopT-type cysteine protease domain-containing protein [Azospirillum doebereinerae]|uniref:Peptidase C58 YopT-type domain-containing protein n=1 Tax=Azospirillum doebereinerae TaxID=92933 RepID=A0A3S0V7Q3_9PROT|nr:YopT-type cysteine protease domain-containing protein [Azospirillum doebereinerae]MCG5242545.1 YopT-type cysteine protease domain-containing protein [Azospirillum doebereinerae]RUQ74043.1 hypothetical protein EJ913_06650 [Azospirillum doebereinerae]
MASFDSYCVAPFKQRYPIRKLFPEDHEVKAGICFGLSSEWIARHRANKGEKPATRIAYIENDNTILHASIKQRLYGRELSHQLDQSAEQTGSRNEALKLLGLSVKSSSTQWVSVESPENVKEVLKAISVATAGAHTYHIITLNFEGRNGGSHATCCYKSSGKAFGMGAHLYFFDPNYGEFKASAGSVIDLFNGLIDRYRHYETKSGALKDYKVQQFVVQSITFA